MKHVAWLKDRSPHHALDGKSPYEMKHKKAPHLGNIHEFGSAAYVKDLKAGKLDAHAKSGWFVGYDSESKGFHIYWPNKWSVTVKHNVIFNQEDVLTKSNYVVIPSDVLSEGERDKLIQHPDNTTKINDEQPDRQIQNHKTLISPNHLSTPFCSLHLKNLNSRHQIAWKLTQLSNQIWAVDIDPVMHLVTMQG